MPILTEPLHWVGAGLALLGIIGATLTGYAGNTKGKQAKYLFLLVIYIAFGLLLGSMALGQTEYKRTDGKTIVYGYTLAWFITTGFVTAFVTLCISEWGWNALVTGLLGLGIGGCAFGAIWATNLAQRLLFFIPACVFWLVLVIYWAFIVFGWDKWLVYPNTRSKKDKSQGDKPGLSLFWRVLVWVVTSIFLLAHLAFLAVEPALWDQLGYSIIEWIYVAAFFIVFDLIWLMILFWFINPDGSVINRRAILNVGDLGNKYVNPSGLPFGRNKACGPKKAGKKCGGGGGIKLSVPGAVVSGGDNLQGFEDEISDDDVDV